MRKSDLTPGTILIEKKAAGHTDLLRRIQICGYKDRYDPIKKRGYTYVTFQTIEGQYYPSNSVLVCPIMDGIVGGRTLANLKKEFNIFYQPV